MGRHPAGAPDDVFLFEKGTANVAEDDASREDVDISILLIFTQLITRAMPASGGIRLVMFFFHDRSMEGTGPGRIRWASGYAINDPVERDDRCTRIELVIDCSIKDKVMSKLEDAKSVLHMNRMP
jgi:hypothetical protein